MEAKIQKQLVDYFCFFSEFHVTADTTLRDCQNCAVTINKLIKRWKNIKKADVAASPLAKFEDLQNKLCAQLNNQISDVISEILCKQSTLEELYSNLCNKNRVLRDSCREADLDETSLLAKGSPTQPALEQLLEYTDDTITFGSHACAQIETALNILSISKLDTVSFADHFVYPVNWFQRIKEIITYTSFLSENQP